MNTKHLNGSGLAAVDAGMLNGDIGSTNGFLQFSNVVPPTFKRVRGNIYAWSATFSGLFISSSRTNFVQTHVLIVDETLKGAGLSWTDVAELVRTSARGSMAQLIDRLFKGMSAEVLGKAWALDPKELETARRIDQALKDRDSAITADDLIWLVGMHAKTARRTGRR